MNGTQGVDADGSERRWSGSQWRWRLTFRPWCVRPRLPISAWQAAMGDGTWNGDKSNCRRSWAMELGMGPNQNCRLPRAMGLGMGRNQIAGGRDRWNLEWGQIKLQAAMNDGTCNGDTSNCMLFRTTLGRQPSELLISAQARAAESSERRWGGSSRRPRLARRPWPMVFQKWAQAVAKDATEYRIAPKHYQGRPEMRRGNCQRRPRSASAVTRGVPEWRTSNGQRRPRKCAQARPGAFENKLALAVAANTSMQLHLLAWLQSPSEEARPRAFENNLASAGAANTSTQLHLVAWLQAPSKQARPRAFENTLAPTGAANTHAIAFSCSVASSLRESNVQCIWNQFGFSRGWKHTHAFAVASVAASTQRGGKARCI